MGDVRATGDMTLSQFITAITEGDAGANKVVGEWINKTDDIGEAIFQMLSLDSKHLYGHRIWEIYSAECGGDINRFIDYVDKLPYLADTGDSPMF